MKTLFFQLLLLCSFGLFTQTANAQAAAGDEATIRAYVDKVMVDYYAGDASKIAGYYTEDAVTIDWMGNKVVGRKAIEEMTKQIFSYGKPTPETFHYAIESITMLPGNNAILLLKIGGKAEMNGQMIEWTAYDASIMVKEKGQWLIKFEQSTSIAPPQGN